MSKLTEKTHWDSVHVGEQKHLFDSRRAEQKEQSSPGATQRAIHAVKKFVGPKVLQGIACYDDYLLWDVLFPRHLPRMDGDRVVEIGSAPGKYIVEFSRRHGCVPHGVEYSEVGVEVSDDRSLVLRAPKEQNKNSLNTAFGGSLV